jgi:hypothetical protein
MTRSLETVCVVEASKPTKLVNRDPVISGVLKHAEKVFTKNVDDDVCAKMPVCVE